MQDIHYPPFNYRICAVIITDGRVLIHRAVHDDFWALPGGRCKLHEQAADALKRELAEEIETDVNVGRLVWLAEMFFEHQDQRWHELGLFFEATIDPGAGLFSRGTNFASEDAGVALEFKWLPLNELQETIIVPRFLKSGLQDLPSETTHLISNELPA